MVENDSRFRLESEPLSPRFQAIAEKELRETPERQKEAIAELKKLLAAATDLHYSTDDDVLVRFLRITKYYPESALALMRRIAEFRVTHADHVGNLMPADEEAAIDSPVVNVLVNRDQLGRRILLVNSGAVWDPKKVNLDQLFRVFYLMHITATLEPQTQVCGIVVLMDFTGLSMKQVTAFGPSFVVRLLSFVQDALALRLKAAHIVMQPFLFNMIFAMFKPFLREKLRNRIFFHGSKMSSLHEHISPECLPITFGGTLPAVDYTSKDWYPNMRKCDDYFREWNSWGIVKKVNS